MKTKKRTVNVSSLLRKLKKLNLREISSADLLRLVIVVREVDSQMKAHLIKPRLMRKALSCTLFKDNIETEMCERKLPDPDRFSYAHKDMFEGMLKSLDNDVLTVLKEHFDEKSEEDEKFRILSNLIHTEKLVGRSFTFNGGCEN